jgi:hypothetical protein
MMLSTHSHYAMGKKAKKETKTAIVQVRIRPALKEAAERAAAADSRSLTSLIEKLLVEHLKTLRLPIDKDRQ